MADEGQKLEFSVEALRVLDEMQDRVVEVGQVYGLQSKEYIEMASSLARALVQMIRLGGKITVDGPLSLYGVSFIHFGVVFHPKWKGKERDPLLGDWSVHS